MGAPTPPEPNFAAAVAELAAFRTGRLKGLPSDRTLAKAAAVSPTTIGEWLRAARFPQQIDPLMALVRAVRIQAKNTGLADDPVASGVLDEQRWRRVFEAEARRRAQSTGCAVEAAQSRAVLERMEPGLPLQEVTDPFHLEVHRAIEARRADLPALPPYVPREHDRALKMVVDQAADGQNGIAVLVGGSSTGKTRALWEVLTRLRVRAEPWRLWHPIDPTRPEAALAELPHLPPHTVVWLNEAQLYLDSPIGEQIASGLRTRLRDPKRAPLLVLATLWPEHWSTLTSRTGTPDGHSQARELLAGRRITVPNTFTGVDLASLDLSRTRDPRLEEAVDHATDGQVIQYLAGGPVLLDLYRDAPPTNRALIDAAMDARRLGAGPHIPSVWLAHAAPGYLTESEWEYRAVDWLEQALAYVTTRHNGVSSILTPVRSSAARNQRATGRMNITSGSAVGHRPQAGQGPLYRLADYLDQYGQHHRAEQIPPIDFWTAAAAYAHSADLLDLGHTARGLGLYRDAAQLYKHATTDGSAAAAAALVSQLHRVHTGIPEAAHYAATHASLDEAYGVAGLLEALREAGTQEQVAVLLARDPATHTNLHEPGAVARLLDTLCEIGAQEQVATLLARDPATHTNLDNRRAVAWLLNALHRAGARDQVTALAKRAVVHTSPADLFTVARRLRTLHTVEAREQAVDLAERVAAYASSAGLQTMVGLLGVLDRAGAQEQVAALLAGDPANHAKLDEPYGVAGLLEALRGAGMQEQVAALLARDPATHTNLDKPSGVARLLDTLCEIGAQEQVATLLARDPATHTNLDEPDAAAGLLYALRDAGAQEQVTALAEQVATRIDLDRADTLAGSLRALHRAGVQEQVAVLLARDPASHTNLHEPDGVAQLLDTLREIGAQEQVATLLARDPATHTNLDRRSAAQGLLHSLCEVGAQEQTLALIERLPAAGEFDAFLEASDQPKRFRFGREPNGDAAQPWLWEDLS
jgi:hypothetical protein